MADIIVTVLLIVLAALALRSCLHQRKKGGCSGCAGKRDKEDRNGTI